MTRKQLFINVNCDYMKGFYQNFYSEMLCLYLEIYFHLEKEHYRGRSKVAYLNHVQSIVCTHATTIEAEIKPVCQARQ